MMTDDAKQSLTALVAVSPIFGIGYFTVQLLKHVDVPRWAPAIGLVLNLLALCFGIMACRQGTGPGRTEKDSP
jgi:hypothetical protein